MKGRSELNRPAARKGNVFRFLTQSGGEARWKTLKAQAHIEKMGPTTLKHTLDEMEREGTIRVEARRGQRGPETWYILAGKDDEIFKQFLERPFGKLVMDIKTNLNSLGGQPEEEKALFKQSLLKLLSILQLQQLHAFELAIKEESLEDACRLYTYIHDGILLENVAAIMGLCSNYPQYIPEATKEAIERLLAALGPLACPEA